MRPTRTGSCATSGSARWSRHRSWPATPSTGRSAPSRPGTTRSAPSDIRLVQALADHAAAAMANARLIEALDRSRRAEQALREIAARITVLRQPTEILRDVVTQAGRLVGADGVILDLVDPTTGNLHWALDDGLDRGSFTEEERAGLWISVGVGATGTAVAEDRVIVADDDLASQFPPSPESTAFYEKTGFHSMIAAPITGDSGPLGVIEVYSKERAAFTETDAGFVLALASQAAIAITNARLIEELASSRAVIERRAEAERALREIATRITAIRQSGRPAPADRRRGPSPAARGRRGHRRIRPGRRRPRLGIRRRPDGRPAAVGALDAAPDGRGPVRPGDGGAQGHRRGRLPRRRVPARRGDR